MKAPRFQFSPHRNALVASLLTWLWAALSYPLIFFRPNDSLLASSKDSVKNIYTLAWQLAYGEPLSWEFTGMGWPFSEHVFYTDGHPLLAWLLGGLVPGVIPAEWTAGLIHIAILASLGFTAFILVKILNFYGARGNWVIVFCSLLPLCHPQILRLTGHYAMAYTYAIPFAWYLQLKWIQRARWKWALLQCTHLLVLLLTHAYLGAMAAAFSGLIAGFYVLNHWRTFAHKVKPLLQVGIATVLPLIVYVAALKATDHHPFRTDQPYGFWDNVSHWSAAFLPSHGGLKAVRYGLGWSLNTWEGWGFWGSGTWLMIVIAFVQVVRKTPLLKPRFRQSEHPTLRFAALSALVLFMIAVGQPFLMGPNEWLYQWPLFMQFRAIGRFVWVAAWIAPIIAAHACFQIATRRSWKWLPWLFVGFFALDGYWMQRECHLEMVIQPNCLAAIDADTQAVLEVAKQTDAVAIHPVPWFQMGSESVGREGTLQAHRQALAASFHSGLPTTATHLTRTSILESRILTEWMSHPGLSRTLLNAFQPSEYGHVILLYACDALSSWSEDDRLLWSRGHPTANSQVRTLTIGEWLKQDPDQADWVGHAEKDSDMLFNGLDELQVPFALEGNGAKKGFSNEYTLIESLTPDSSWLGRTIEASCWFWHDSPHAGRDALQFEWVMEAQWSDGTSRWVSQLPVASSGDHAEGWTRASIRYTLDDLPKTLQCFAVGFGESRNPIWADAFRAQFLPENAPSDNSVRLTQGAQEVSP